MIISFLETGKPNPDDLAPRIRELKTRQDSISEARVQTEEKQAKKDTWEKKRVQRVLDYHNRKYGTNFVLKGKTQKVYPQLKGKSDWDWVCRDTERNEEIAVEVKKLTDEKLEKRHNIIGDILEEIQNDLSNKLPGTFLLVNTISPRNSYLPFRGPSGRQNKQKFKDVLYKAIHQTAQRLKVGEEQAITPQITAQLPFALPESFFLCSPQIQ